MTLRYPRRRFPARAAPALLLPALLLGACEKPGPAPAATAQAVVRETAADTLPSIPDSAFAALVSGLSEAGGYFDTDNLISNESSYLHAVNGLEERGIRGGVYLGVGPGQNFSYMAAVRPELAFLVDIRRDNLLQHLWYKALFERSGSRLDYLCLLVARDCGGASDGLTLQELVRSVDDAAPVDTLDALLDGVTTHAAATGVTLDEEDRATIRSIHARFARYGLGLRFNTHGQAPRPSYPSLRELLLERDRDGRTANYLAREEDYRYLAAMQAANRVVPVVGDLAGQHALPAIGRELRTRGLEVTAFYTSNVEFYLFGDGAFPRFVANLEALPIASEAVVIRSYFNRFRTLPSTVPGYASTQLLHAIPALLQEWQEGRIRGYMALVTSSSAR